MSLQGTCQSLQGLDDHCLGGYFGVCYVLELEKYCFAYLHCSCPYNIELEAAMVFHLYTYVESGFRMVVPRSASIGFYMGLYCAPQGGKGLPHVIILARDMGIGKYLWGNILLA